MRDRDLKRATLLAGISLGVACALLLCDAALGLLHEHELLAFMSRAYQQNGLLRAMPVALAPAYAFIHKATYMLVAIELSVLLFVCLFARVRAYTGASRRQALYALSYALVTIAVVMLLKRVWGRPRPIELIVQSMQTGGALKMLSWLPLAHKGGTSFPSGHTTVAISLAAFAFYPRVGWTRGLLLGLGAVLVIGSARVLSMYHYPSDVLAATAIGLLLWLIVKALYIRNTH